MVENKDHYKDFTREELIERILRLEWCMSMVSNTINANLAPYDSAKTRHAYFEDGK